MEKKSVLNRVVAIQMALALAVGVSCTPLLCPAPLRARAVYGVLDVDTGIPAIDFIANFVIDEVSNRIIDSYTSLNSAELDLLKKEMAIAGAVIDTCVWIQNQQCDMTKSNLTAMQTFLFYYSTDGGYSSTLETAIVPVGKFYLGSGQDFTAFSTSVGACNVHLRDKNENNNISMMKIGKSGTGKFNFIYGYNGDYSTVFDSMDITYLSQSATWVTSSYSVNYGNSPPSTSYCVKSSRDVGNYINYSFDWNHILFFDKTELDLSSYDFSTYDGVSNAVASVKNAMIEEYGQEMVDEYWMLDYIEPETEPNPTAELAPVVNYPDALPYQQMPDFDFDMSLPEKALSGAKFWFTLFSDFVTGLGATGIVLTFLLIALFFWLVI